MAVGTLGLSWQDVVGDNTFSSIQNRNRGTLIDNPSNYDDPYRIVRWEARDDSGYIRG